MELRLATLMNQIVRLMRRAFDERARDIGVTRPQWQVLYTLAEHEGIKQSGLAELLEVEPITAGRMIDRMQESGLVERRPDPCDRRVWRLHLTAQGRAVRGQLEPIAQELVQITLQDLDPGERVAILAMLEKMRHRLMVASGCPEFEQD